MTGACNFHELANMSAAARAALMKRADQDIGPFLDKVRPILAAVKAEGDQALSRYTREFDKADVSVDRILVTEQEFEDAFRMLDPAVREAIEVAVKAIRTFHEEQLPEPMWLKETSPGAFAGDRWHPIASVGLYVPRGKGSFPSVTMMTAIPAIVAGVPEIAIFTPPAPDGTVDAGVLVAAKLVGVTRIYKCGGSQAIAAAAYGTETVRKVLKIVGPGSPWVVAAKRLLSDVVDVGLPAGPSEAIIFADESADGRMASLDLLIEAEHGPDSSAYLVTNSRKVAEDALTALPDYWAAMTLPNRIEFSKAVVTGPRGGIVLVRSIQDAYDFINDYAPEHLEVLSSEPFKHLAGITNASEVLLGSRTPVTIANFMLGPNGVLPTGGWARTFGPLSVTDYMKRSSIGYVTSVGYPGLARRSKLLAEYEGFSSHANAVSEIRDRLLEGSTA
jgi:histidinol dehydrogenase